MSSVEGGQLGMVGSCLICLFEMSGTNPNDRLRLHFYKKKTRLTMIDGGDEYAQNNKGGPLRVHRSHSNL